MENDKHFFEDHIGEVRCFCGHRAARLSGWICGTITRFGCEYSTNTLKFKPPDQRHDVVTCDCDECYNKRHEPWWETLKEILEKRKKTT